jgi:hypothetical protein
MGGDMPQFENEIASAPEITALVPLEPEAFMPALSIQQAVERFNSVVEFVRTVMREGVDYGRIPGTDKPTLLKPGAEKLCTLFGLSSRFQLIRWVEDWTGSEHKGEPFFYYLYRCQLLRGDLVITEGDGSCNSFEQKYRYRDAQRKCPVCGQAAIIRGKEEYGGGHLCFRKKGGCGAKFDADDPRITSQPAGRVPNENIADQVNTIQKMAQKRAIIAATLLAVNGSEFFTQDTEDMTITFSASNGGEYRAAEPHPPSDIWEPTPSSRSTDEPSLARRSRKELIDHCASLCRSLKAAGHSDFKDKDAIVQHLRRKVEEKGFLTGNEAGQLKGLSELSTDLLSDYAALLEQELELVKRIAS